MLSVIHEDDSMRIRFSSTFQNVGGVIEHVREYLKQYRVEDDRSLVLALRELVNNAIEHGNKKIPDLNVAAHIENAGYLRFKITVRDEGRGFDHESIDLNMPDDPSQLRNRGLCLVNAFSDALEFNDAGNCAIAWLTITQVADFRVSDDHPWKVITPTSDLTAETAEKFRVLLLSLMDSGHENFRFDLAGVRDMDSIILSIFVVLSNMMADRFPDGNLEILHANKDIINLFRITRLDQIYNIGNGNQGDLQK